jgi:putative restriction endonuclease
MSLRDITDPDAVRSAIEEFRRLGRDSFLARYGFGHARDYFLIDEGERFDSKAIAAAAHGVQFPHAGPLKADEFSGGDVTVRRQLEQLGFVVTGPERPVPETLNPDASSVQVERNRRADLWSRLIAHRGPSDVPASVLNDLKIFYGGRGIWVDKATTAGIGGSINGVTVGLLHTGSAYADDLSEDSVIYHYPQTEQGGRDEAEISATKAAATLLLPVFFVSYSRPRAPTRDVKLAWVQVWDDDQKWFYVRFGEQPPSEPPPSGEPETPFAVTTPREIMSRTSKARKRSAAFKFAVFDRYRPAECCVCGIQIAELLDAAHIVGVEHDGTDDPRNGLIFCATHHRAFDANMFAINPTDLQVISGERQPSLDAIGIERRNLSALPRSPHNDALRWRWERWKHRPGVGLALRRSDKKPVG